jgi:hypothetical protein
VTVHGDLSVLGQLSGTPAAASLKATPAAKASILNAGTLGLLAGVQSGGA